MFFVVDDAASDRVGPAWRYTQSYIVGAPNDEASAAVVHVPKVILELVHNAWFVRPRMCRRCRITYRECDNLGAHQCLYHPAPVTSGDGVHQCCGRNELDSRGCVQCDHCDTHFDWSTEASAPNFLLTAIPLCVMAALPKNSQPKHLMRTVGCYAMEAKPTPEQLQLPYPHYIPRYGPVEPLTWRLQQAPSDVPLFARFNEEIRHETDRQDYYTLVDKEFTPYAIISRIGERPPKPQHH